MAWSKEQKMIASIAKRVCGWNDPQYRLVLRNAGVHEHRGKVSATNPLNDNPTLERFMAIAERAGFIDPKNGAGYWQEHAATKTPRIHHRIRELRARAYEAGIIKEDALPAFIQRMTADAPLGPFTSLEECDWQWSFKILLGFEAWVFRDAKRRGVTLGA